MLNSKINAGMNSLTNLIHLGNVSIKNLCYYFRLKSITGMYLFQLERTCRDACSTCPKYNDHKILLITQKWQQSEVVPMLKQPSCHEDVALLN